MNSHSPPALASSHSMRKRSPSWRKPVPMYIPTPPPSPKRAGLPLGPPGPKTPPLPNDWRATISRVTKTASEPLLVSGSGANKNVLAEPVPDSPVTPATLELPALPRKSLHLSSSMQELYGSWLEQAPPAMSTLEVRLQVEERVTNSKSDLNLSSTPPAPSHYRKKRSTDPITTVSQPHVRNTIYPAAHAPPSRSQHSFHSGHSGSSGSSVDVSTTLYPRPLRALNPETPSTLGEKQNPFADAPEPPIVRPTVSSSSAIPTTGSRERDLPTPPKQLAAPSLLSPTPVNTSNSTRVTGRSALVTPLSAASASSISVAQPSAPGLTQFPPKDADGVTNGNIAPALSQSRSTRSRGPPPPPPSPATRTPSSGPSRRNRRTNSHGHRGNPPPYSAQPSRSKSQQAHTILNANIMPKEEVKYPPKPPRSGAVSSGRDVKPTSHTSRSKDNAGYPKRHLPPGSGNPGRRRDTPRSNSVWHQIGCLGRMVLMKIRSWVQVSPS